MKRAAALLAVLAFLAPADAASLWPKDAAFETHPAEGGRYPEDVALAATPEDGSTLVWSEGGHVVPVAWAVPGDPRAQTGRSPAWTSAGYVVRLTEPDGVWTQQSVRDDRVLVVATGAGARSEHEGHNYTRADFARCTEAVAGACARYADDTRFRAVAYLVRAVGTYTLDLTLVDVDGGARTHTTTFAIAPRPPSAPTLVALPGPAPGAATLLWTPPESDGGAPVERYEVWRSGPDGEVVLAGETQATRFDDAGLAPGVHVYFVLARNAAGAGAGSEAVPVASSGRAPLAVEAEVHALGHGARVAL